MKIKNILKIAIFSSLLFALVNSEATHAGWQGGGGDVAGKCVNWTSIESYMNSGYVCYTSGYGWVYYEYDVDDPPDIIFGPFNDNSGGSFTIPSQCKDYDGFYHFGFYSYKKISQSYTMEGYTWTPNSINGYSDAGNPKYSAFNGDFEGLNFDLMNSNLNHIFYGANGEQIAHAVAAVTTPDAKKAYDEYVITQEIRTGKKVERLWDFNNRYNSPITGFCGNEPGAYTFTGVTTAKIDGTSVSRGATQEVETEQHTITFQHEITRTDNYSNVKNLNNNWSVDASSTPTGYGTSSGNRATTFNAGDNKIVYTDGPIQISLQPLESVTVCEKLNYDSEIIDNEDYDGFIVQKRSSTPNFCVTIKRQDIPIIDLDGSFIPKQTCEVEAGGITKGNSCNKTYETNSKSWRIKHNSYVSSNASGTVPAGTSSTSNDTWGHGSQQYGVSGQCVRSYNPYTHWDYFEDGIKKNSGLTLRDTGSMDMPITNGNPAPNYHDTGEDEWVEEGHWEDRPGTHLEEDGDPKYEIVRWDTVDDYVSVCTNVGANNGSYSNSSCTKTSSKPKKNTYGWVSKKVGSHLEPVYGYVQHYVEVQNREWVDTSHWEDIYDYWEDDCEADYTTWYDFDSSNQQKTWLANNDSSLLFSNGSDTVSIVHCSEMDVVKNYHFNGWSGTWDGLNKSKSCNTVTRYRRYANFKTGTFGIKADAGTMSTATTTRSLNDSINTSNNDGKFTITFSYSIDRGDTRNWKDGEPSKNFTVNNKWGSKETAYAADGSGRVYTINGTYNQWHEYGQFTSTNANTANVGGTKTQTITGQLYYGQKIKVCGNMYYGNEVRELDGGSEISRIVDKNSATEVGCVYVYRNEANCSNVVGNNPSATGYSFGHQSGYNTAKIGVMNASIGMTTPQYTTWSYGQSTTNTSIWARPGDFIRYQVNYCMGANYGHAVHKANGINDNGVDTTLHMNGDSVAQTAADTAKVSAEKRSNYLFGDTVSTYNPTTKTTTPTTFNFTKYNANGTINESSTIADSTTIGSLRSPDISGSSATKKRYSCKNGGNGNEMENYYQIAGKVKRDGNYTNSDNYSIDGCAENRTQSLDVGRELSEQLLWTNMRIASVSSTITNGEYSHKASVRVPYNYTAKPYLKNNSNPTGTVQIGGKMSTTPGIAVFPRKNCAFLPNYSTDGSTHDHTSCQSASSSYATYATVTKPTTVTLQTYVNNSPVGAATVWTTRANTKSYLNGSKVTAIAGSTESNGGPSFDNEYVIDVPNTANPGDQICIKMTISPADSHNSPSSATVMGASIDYAETENTGDFNRTYWALREDGTSSETVTTCSTAVKRPTMSVEESNLYSATSISTSTIARKNGSDTILYGSWAEYGVFGNVITGTHTDSVSTLGMASGAALGYNQNSFYSNHQRIVTGYNPQPLTVVRYNGGPKNGDHKYNYSRITSSATQRVITYNYVLNTDGSHSYQLVSNITTTIGPSSYSFTDPIVNSGNATGVAKQGATVCALSTQTFANNQCDTGSVGTSTLGADAANVFTTNILDRYGSKLKSSNTQNATNVNGYKSLTDTNIAAEQIEGDEDTVLYKNVDKGFLGYTGDNTTMDLTTLAIKSAGTVEGQNINQTMGSVIVYKANTIVINSDIIANSGEKNNAGDFKMPIIIADKVWITGNPKRIDAIIIANSELNTCKWTNYNAFVSNISPTFPTKSGEVWSNGANEMSASVCTNSLRFTAPVVVKGKLILNRTGGAGAGNDQSVRAEIFELNPATYLWSYAEMSRYSQAITTYSRELPARY